MNHLCGSHCLTWRRWADGLKAGDGLGISEGRSLKITKELEIAEVMNGLLELCANIFSLIPMPIILMGDYTPLLQTCSERVRYSRIKLVAYGCGFIQRLIRTWERSTSCRAVGSDVEKLLTSSSLTVSRYSRVVGGPWSQLHAMADSIFEVKVSASCGKCGRSTYLRNSVGRAGGSGSLMWKGLWHIDCAVPRLERLRAPLLH